MDTVSLEMARKLKEANVPFKGKRWAMVTAHYAISDKGEVASLKRPGNPKTRLLKHGLINGYPATDVGKIHRLMAKAFIPNPKKYPCINHLDHDRKNFELSNLEWCTYGMNLKHEYATGRRSNKGKRNPNYGKRASTETRAKISRKMKGNKNAKPERRARTKLGRFV